LGQSLRDIGIGGIDGKNRLEFGNGCHPVASFSSRDAPLVGSGQCGLGGSSHRAGGSVGFDQLGGGFGLPSGFGLHIGLGDGLIGGAGTSRGGSSLRADGAVFTLAIEEQPSTGCKDERSDHQYGKSHAPATGRRLLRFGRSAIIIPFVVKAIVATSTCADAPARR
jgi:hypothetical protein